MKGADCQLPIQEDYSSFFNNGKKTSSRQKKLLIVAGFLLLTTLSIMTGFTFRSFFEIRELKQEIEQIKTSMQTLQEKYNNFHVSGISTTLDPDDYQDYYEDVTYEENNRSDDDYNGDTISWGEDFIKDTKEVTAPPRAKRDIVANTQDVLSNNSEAQEETKIKNTTENNHRHQHYTTVDSDNSDSYSLHPELTRYQEVVQSNTPSPKSTFSKRTRAIYKHQTPRKVNFLKSGDTQYSGDNPDVEFTIVTDNHFRKGRRRHGQKQLEFEEGPVRTGRMRPLPTAHFHGDTSKYILGQHENFDGNGRLYHPGNKIVDWIESSWFRSLGMHQHFSLDNGILTIKEPGLYFIYAQIYYHDVHDTTGFKVYKNDGDELLRCTTMIPTTTRTEKGNTCYTAAAEYLEEDDGISISDISGSHYTLFEPGKSFFGIIKLGDVKIK